MLTWDWIMFYYDNNKNKNNNNEDDNDGDDRNDTDNGGIVHPRPALRSSTFMSVTIEPRNLGTSSHFAGFWTSPPTLPG
ncbi:hypothetical protein EX30DRAFT_342515 [Ascodesmis nigricans]|uniref:Uncharacterized protein n=1 Tax=Ascodesmis nigricans TaxID=341454 RepID=A0A4S2MQ55_9PEZI|nr:hypothetical protein EX30DRAFT_342515 [Ascodesmis nigricans]